MEKLRSSGATQSRMDIREEKEKSCETHNREGKSLRQSRRLCVSKHYTYDFGHIIDIEIPMKEFENKNNKKIKIEDKKNVLSPFP